MNWSGRTKSPGLYSGFMDPTAVVAKMAVTPRRFDRCWSQDAGPVVDGAAEWSASGRDGLKDEVPIVIGPFNSEWIRNRYPGTLHGHWTKSSVTDAGTADTAISPMIKPPFLRNDDQCWSAPACIRRLIRRGTGHISRRSNGRSFRPGDPCDSLSSGCRIRRFQKRWREQVQRQ